MRTAARAVGQFGDWLDPDAPPDRPWVAKCDSELFANAFFAQSARLPGGGAGSATPRPRRRRMPCRASRSLTWSAGASDALDHADGLRDRP